MSDAVFDSSGLQEICERVVEKAKARGADVVEAVARGGSSLSVRVREQKPELVQQADSRSIALRVMRGQNTGGAVSSDLTDRGLDRLIDDALELASLSEADPMAGPPSPELLAQKSELANLQLTDPNVMLVGADEAIRRASAGEVAAFAVDPRINKSEGASFGRTAGGMVIVTSHGFSGSFAGTYASLSVRPVADETAEKKCNASAWTASRFLSDLESEAVVGARAGRRLVDKFGARKVPTQEVPVIFDRDAASSMLGLLAGCITGGAIWRRSSYLMDREHSRIASDLVNIVDDPLIPRAPGSRPFDGEGLLSRKNSVVEHGVLKTFLLDVYSGRKLGRPSTASAVRAGASSIGASTSNFIMQNGNETPEALIARTPKGLYVTDMMGFGFNGVTGDFSRGASGFWIENGEKTFAVSEITISLNLDQILQRIDGIANDLELRTSTAAPTFRVSGMMVAGS